MAGTNGINGFGRIPGARKADRANYLQIAKLLEQRCSPSAQRLIQQRLRQEKNRAHLVTVYERTCAVLGLEIGKFADQAFLERFSRWQIEGLDKETNPYSSDYHVRFLLERKFDCALAYHRDSGLTIVTLEERALNEYQFASPFPQKLSLLLPIATPTITPPFVRQAGAIVKHAAFQLVGLKDTYGERIRQRIIFHAQEGHYRSATLLLFQGKNAKGILKTIRKDLAEVIAVSPELNQLIELCLRSEAMQPPTVEEIIAGFLLREVHPVIAAHFLEDLGKANLSGAAKILGIMGMATRSVEISSFGDLTDYTELSLAGFALSPMITRREYRLANQLVASGLADPLFEPIYECVLNELHSVFDERILTAEAYRRSDRTSLFSTGEPLSRQIPEKPDALIRVGNSPYTYGGEELFAPRLFYKKLAAQLVENGEYDDAWEILTVGRSAADAFSDLNSMLHPVSIGRLLSARDRKETVQFIVEVYKSGITNIEEHLAYALRNTYEDPKDVANFFEYMIEADQEIAGSREAAYAILFFAAVDAIARESLEPLMESYQAILAQIEDDKRDAGWFSVDVFLRQGRFIVTDPPSKVRAERLKHYFGLLKDNAQPLEHRIFAARMLGRMGAIKYFTRLIRMANKRKDLCDDLTSVIFVSIAHVFGQLDSKNERERKLRDSFGEKYISSGGRKSWFIWELVYKEDLIKLGIAAIPALTKALEDQDPVIRKVAADALGKIGHPDAIPALTKALEDRDLEVRKAAVEALGKIGHPDAIPALTKVLEDGVALGHRDESDTRKDVDVRKAAVEALGKIGHPDAIPALIIVSEERLYWWSAEVSKVAVEALGKIGHPDAIPALTKALQGDREDWYVRVVAAKSLLIINHFTNDSERKQALAYVHVDNRDWNKLLDLGEEAAIMVLRKALDVCHIHIRDIVEVLVKIGVSAIPILEKALRDALMFENIEGKAAAKALGKIGIPAIPALTNAFDFIKYRWRWEKSPDVIKAVVEVLGEIGHPAAIPTLSHLLTYFFPGHPDIVKVADVRKSAAEALGKIGHPDAIPALTNALDDLFQNLESIPRTKSDQEKVVDVRKAALEALGKIGDPAAIPVLERNLRIWEVRKAAAEALRKIQGKK